MYKLTKKIHKKLVSLLKKEDDLIRIKDIMWSIRLNGPHHLGTILSVYKELVESKIGDHEY